MVTSRKLRKYPAGKLIIALAVVDCLYIIRPFFGFWSNTGLQSFFSCSMLYTSVLILLLISINRYYIVCRPLHHHRVTSFKSILCQLILVLIGSFISLVFEIVIPRITLILCATIVVIITVIILVLTICIYHSLSQNKHSLGTNRPIFNLENQMTKAMLSVLFKFVFLLLPYILTCLLAIIFHNSKLPVPLFAMWLLLLLFTTNFVINFFLYVWYSPEFRSSFISLMTFRRCRGQSVTTNNSLLLYSIQVPYGTRDTP